MEYCESLLKVLPHECELVLVFRGKRDRKEALAMFETGYQLASIYTVSPLQSHCLEQSQLELEDKWSLSNNPL